MDHSSEEARYQNYIVKIDIHLYATRLKRDINFRSAMSFQGHMNSEIILETGENGCCWYNSDNFSIRKKNSWSDFYESNEKTDTQKTCRPYPVKQRWKTVY
ncbi:hypothetical protein TNCV_4377221 [Trichonephila clavipes]|nr:hypothetical protein TNCV_4377221 [Trichonephila clavipes]